MADWPKSGEEALLIERVQGGEIGAAEELLAPYRTLLASLARRFCVKTVPTEELVQAGYVGMLRAAKRYDLRQATRFVTYAVPWALGEMRRALRQALDTTGAYDRRRQLIRQEETLRMQLGHAPGTQELARACGMTDWELVQALCVSAPISLDADMSSAAQRDRGSTALEERIAGGEIDLDAIDLRLALGRLGEEERKLILLRYFGDRTQKEAARLLGKSQTQISRIERRALDELKELLSRE